MNVNKKYINYKRALPLSFPFLLSVYKSKLIKCREEDFDHMSQLDPFEAMEGNELSDILMNPQFQGGDPELLMEESMFNSIIPPQFAYLHSQFKTSLEQESWKGLRLGLSWHPTMTLNSEFSLTIDKARGFLNNYTLSTTTILPNEQNPNKGLVFLGRSEGGKKLMFQSHMDVTNKDKLIIAAHYMTPDINQGAYEVEFNKKLDRMQMDFKFSQMGFTYSAVTALMKGTFVGFEMLYTQKAPKLMYSYGFKTTTPIKDLSLAATYISYMPLYMCDIMYRFNRDLSAYFSYMKNEMVGKTDYKVTAKYRMKETEVMLGLEGFNNFHTFVSHRLNKYVTLQLNAEMNVMSLLSRKKKGFNGKFGLGLQFSTPSQEDLLPTPDKEDFSNFSYDDYLKM